MLLINNKRCYNKFGSTKTKEKIVWKRDNCMTVKILTDSTSYIKDSIMKGLDIRLVSLNVSFSDESIKETDIDNENFYIKMEKKGIPTSSQPSIGDLYNEMKNVVQSGDSLVCVFLSSDMSGTYSTAFLARDMILEEFQDAKIDIIDSRSNSMQLGFAAIVAARAALAGHTHEYIIKEVAENIKRSRFLFIPDNLEYLKKGGRIGGASAIIGNLLKIIPILTVEDGKTSIMAKVRTKQKAIAAMIEKMLEDISENGLVEIAIHHINCYNEALDLVNKIKEKVNIEIPIFDIGPVIGLHVGPGAIGIVYYTENDLR